MTMNGAISGVLSSGSWTAMGAPLANHLWQSTLFAGVVWLLTFLLKKNRAQARYALWLVASVKFLIPFSLLVSLGSYVSWLKGASAQIAVSVVLLRVSGPFGRSQGLARLLPEFLAAAWLCGCAAVLILSRLRWNRVTAAVRQALPVHSGAELETLRQLERSLKISRRIQLLASDSSLEPGIIGILRPVLLLPVGIADRLDHKQLTAILTHELCHVRRRDNLAAALHMLVEAVFWFHPLVWWIGARLVEERERACDEEVLSLGSDPEVYAEGILKVCEFYLESPLACAAGITGSNLKRRMEEIMHHRIARKLGFGKRVLLGVMASAVIAGPLLIGIMNPSAAAAQSGDAEGKPSQGTGPVHVRGDIMQGMISKKVNPEYPDAARNARIQGTVVLEVTVKKDGAVKNVRIVSGHPLLAPAALDAVKQWVYKPFLLNAKPVEVLTQVKVNFTLAD